MRYETEEEIENSEEEVLNELANEMLANPSSETTEVEVDFNQEEFD